MEYNKKNIQLIIPMSGVGRRFIDAGFDVPKPLVEVDGYPMIQHVVNLFPGVDDVLFICNVDHIRNTDMNNILTEISPNCRIHTIEKARGPVDAVLKASHLINETKEAIVSYCDYGTVWDFDEFIKKTRNSECDGMIPCYTGFHPHMLGHDNYAFCREANGMLLEIQEKRPFTKNKMSEFASNGTYYFRNGGMIKKYFSDLVDLNMDLNGEFYVSMVYNLLVRDGMRVGIFEIDKLLQWGTPSDLNIYKWWSDYFFEK